MLCYAQLCYAFDVRRYDIISYIGVDSVFLKLGTRLVDNVRIAVVIGKEGGEI